MSDVKPSALYESCERSVFRLEIRNHYDVPWEAAELEAFTNDRRLLLEEPSIQGWLEQVRALTAAGKRLQRVHVVDRPLTPYLEWEFAAYRSSIEAGEDVRIAERGWDRELEGLTEDFVIIDLETDHPSVLWYEYDDEGRLEGYRFSEAPADVERCAAERALALEHAVPLDKFVTLVDAG